MDVEYAVSYFRSAGGYPGGNQRWDDATAISFIDRGVKQVVSDVLFPESRLTLTTTLNQQEYQLPPMHGVYRVYVNGQIATEVPGNVDTLEGRQILYNDSTAQGTPTAGSGGPPTTGGSMLPQWTIQTPVAYPFLNSWGAPAPYAQPFYPGQSPRFYRRGGFIGIVPQIGTPTQLTVEGVRIPDTVTSMAAEIIVPDNFLEAIIEFALYRALGADKDEVSQAMSKDHLSTYQNFFLRKLRTWKRLYAGDEDALLPMTYRGAYRYGGNRAGGSW